MSSSGVLSRRKAMPLGTFADQANAGTDRQSLQGEIAGAKFGLTQDQDNQYRLQQSYQSSSNISDQRSV